MAGAVLISQNTAQNRLKKVHVTLSISELARDYAKQNNLNMSSVLENALKSGSFDIKKSSSGANRHITGFICENDSKLIEFSSNVEVSKHFDFVRASDTRIYPEVLQTNRNSIKFNSFDNDFEITNLERLFLENHKNLEISNFFINYKMALFNVIMTNTEAILNNAGYPPELVNAVSAQLFSMMVNGGSTVPQMKQPENLSIAEYFARHELEFREYARDDIKTERVLDSYCKYLSGMYSITKPADITNYKVIHGKHLNKNQKNALSKIFKFMRFSQGMDEFNGISIERFTVYLHEAKLNNETRSGRQRRISTESLRLCFEKIHHKQHEDFIRKVGKLIYYSGARYEQIIRVLASKHKHIEKDGDICVVDASTAQIGEHKQAIRFYFPVECYDFIKNCKVPTLKHNTAKKTQPKYFYQWIEHGLNVHLDNGDLINVSSLRKYNYNVLRLDLKADKNTADMIQSRVTSDIGDKHYLDGDGLCRSVYKDAVKIYRERLPWE